MQYDFAGRLASWQKYMGTFNNYSQNLVDTYAIETRGYNVNGQLTGINWSQDSANGPYGWSPAAGIQYVYSATQNNGQITQSVEAISGQTVSYKYDASEKADFGDGESDRNG